MKSYIMCISLHNNLATYGLIKVAKRLILLYQALIFLRETSKKSKKLDKIFGSSWTFGLFVTPELLLP